MLKVVSLFSGIGGLDLGVKDVIKTQTEVYVEIDDYCQEVLRARMNDGYLDQAEIVSDIKEFQWGQTDMVIAGFPCQPFSFAGARNENDDRNLWEETYRVIRMVRPRFVFLENVPAILHGANGKRPYVLQVLGDIARDGFDAEWQVTGADETGSPHRRKRWFCLAYKSLDDSNQFRTQGTIKREHASVNVPIDCKPILGNSHQFRLLGRESEPEATSDSRISTLSRFTNGSEKIPFYPPTPTETSKWEELLSVMPKIEPSFCGISDAGQNFRRLERLKALGNAVAWETGSKALSELLLRIES